MDGWVSARAGGRLYARKTHQEDDELVQRRVLEDVGRALLALLVGGGAAFCGLAAGGWEEGVGL